MIWFPVLLIVFFRVFQLSPEASRWTTSESLTFGWRKRCTTLEKHSPATSYSIPSKTSNWKVIDFLLTFKASIDIRNQVLSSDQLLSFHWPEIFGRRNLLGLLKMWFNISPKDVAKKKKKSWYRKRMTLWSKIDSPVEPRTCIDWILTC